ncbi:MAG: methylmalonyl-CoA mutase family protein [Roseiflexaceae bacterium]
MGSDARMPEQRLLAEFAPVSAADWRAVVEAELNGQPFSRLISRTLEGIDLQPIYSPEDGAAAGIAEPPPPGHAPFVRGNRASMPADGPWLIAHSVAAASALEAQQLTQFALERGATALILSPSTPTDLAIILQDVALDAIALFVDLPIPAAAAAALALGQLGPSQSLRGAIGSDPLVHGDLGSVADLAMLTTWAAAHAPQLATIHADASRIHAAGGSAVEELAYLLASAVAQIRALEQHGLDASIGIAHLRFQVAIGTQIFLEIAKLRAARLLWARVAALCGAADQAARLQIHASGAARSYTIADAHTNLLRGTAQAFAAAVGGANSIEVPAYTSPFAPANEFARRMALNTQHLLREESQIGEVIDPAGGAWFVEVLTDTLARRAWELFQQIEQAGGLPTAQPLLDRMVAEVAAQRAKQIATRREVLVGTSMYANPDERLPTEPISTADQRLAAPFERLRQRAEAAGRPQVFLANIGPRAQHRARADFVIGFLEVAGLRIIDNAGFADAPSAAQAALASEAALVVICSSDQSYPEIVPAFMQQIQSSATTQVVAPVVALAGYPTDQIAAHQAAGVAHFVHLRADLITTLTAILDALTGTTER